MEWNDTRRNGNEPSNFHSFGKNSGCILPVRLIIGNRNPVYVILSLHPFTKYVIKLLQTIKQTHYI